MFHHIVVHNILLNMTHDTCPALTGTSGSLFISLVNTLYATQCTLQPNGYLPKDCGPSLKNNDEFDFIIIGGGTAGSVLASRLTEYSKFKVLLIEAGGYPSSTTEIPALAPTLFGTNEDWKYRTETSLYSCRGLIDGRCKPVLGKMLGGCSSIDFMTYLRGNKRDYDNWQSYGSQGWCWDDVLPYFKKSQNVLKESLKTNPLYGIGGLLPTSQVESQSYFNQLIKAARELGLSIEDYSKDLGVFETMLTVENGKRVSAAKAFLSVAAGRSNLCVALNAHVTKIVIESSIATAVQVKINGKIITIKTRNEIIVSAGSINSAQILMLSGIGPKAHLSSKNININCIEDLPVGQNLQDHTANLGLFISYNESPSVRKTPLGTIEDILEYFTKLTGPYTSNLMNLQTFVNTKKDSIYPNLYWHIANYVKNDNFMNLALDNIGFNAISKNNLKSINSGTQLLHIILTLLNPLSTGSVTLNSNDPFAAPIINGNYFSRSEDVTIIIEAIEQIKLFLATPTMSGLNAKIVNYTIPNCSNLAFNTKPYWECVIKNFGGTMYRPVGTCKMGSQVDRTAVVDNRLKVYGLRNVRVVSGAIMPKIVSGNSQASTIMIAEKGADFIKEDWSCLRCGA